MDAAARLRQEVEGFADRSGADHFIRQSDLGQHVHAVGRDLQAPADAGRVGPGFEQLDVEPCALEEDRGDRSGDTGADDEGFARALRHGLLH